MSSYSTVNGADFSTQNYRHGVLVGNWNEDEFGVSLIRSDPIKQAKYEDTFRTTQRLNYNNDGLIAARQEMFENRFRIQKGAEETSKDLIFSHGTEEEKSAESPEARFQTTYNSLHNAGGFKILPGSSLSGETSLVATIERKKIMAEQERESGARSRSYETTSRSALDRTIAEQSKGVVIGAGMSQGGEKSHRRKHEFGKKFESAAHALNLRK